jgi:hypothetical protein
MNINEEDKVANKNNNLNSNDNNIDFYEYEILNQKYGLCPECNQLNTEKNWCRGCNSKRFQQNFGNWTSGNEHVDKFIQESQLKARNKWELLEWIPYTQLRNIKFLAEGGSSTVYKGIWLDGLIEHWDYEKQVWKRKVYENEERCYEDANNPNIKNPLKSTEKYGYPIAIKSLNDSSNINEDFLNKVVNNYFNYICYFNNNVSTISSND